MQNKQQIIRSWLKKRVIEARNSNEMYQRFHNKLRYDFRDRDLITYNPKELSEFWELSVNPISHPERTWVNPSDPSIKIVIPAMSYVSCKLRIDPSKHQDFISYWMSHAKPDRCFRIGWGWPWTVICETGMIFDTNQTSIDKIVDYCEAQWRNSDYLGECLSDTIEHKTDLMECSKATSDRPKKYNIDCEYGIRIDIFDWWEDDLDKLSSEKLDEIILWEWIK
jgi:hypothetical protein